MELGVLEDEQEIQKLLKADKIIKLSVDDKFPNYEVWVIREGDGIFYWKPNVVDWDNMALKFYFPH